MVLAVMTSKTLAALLAVIFAACMSGGSTQDRSGNPVYEATGSCETNQVCTYKYAAEQQHFGGDQQQTIAVGAVVEVSCNSVGTYNDTSATEHCIKVRDTSLTGPMFQERKQTRDLEKYVDKLLAGWFCFVQTVEGKVATVSYASTDDLQAVNLKKSIAAAFQANFKGTEEEEETDPQSTHISHYRYIPTNDGIQKMHRSISSRDVEEYSTDVQSRDIQLTKDEDIEYRSGTLYSSSGTTFVEILAFSQGTQQQLADEEEPSNLTDSNTFAVNGSYTLDRMQCYTLSKSAAAQRNGRSVDNMVVTSLKATVNKRSIDKQHLEDLRRQLPSPSQVLMKVHQDPENIELVSKLQRLLVLEAEHGPLPGTAPALTDVFNYLENIDQSQDPKDVQMRHTIYSLLAQEGTLESQMALLNALVHGNDEEKNNIIIHIAFTNNAHMDFVEKLEDLITKETVNTDSLLLAYGALAASTSSRVQQHIVLFLKRRLIQQMELNDTTNTVHLLHALGNTGSKRIVNLLFDYLAHSDSIEIQLAAIGAMRKLTAQQSVQESFVAILESNPHEVFIEAIAKTLFTGQEHSNVMRIHIDENTRLLNALVTSSLRFSNNTELHHLVHSYLELVDTAESHRLGKLLERPVSNRVRRESTDNWTSSDPLYNCISPLSSRQNDSTSYPLHKAYLWKRKLGISKINIQLVAGAFAGVKRDLSNMKLLGKAVAKGTFFGRTATIADASAVVLYQSDHLRVKLYFELLGSVLLDDNHTNFTLCCLRANIPVHRSRYCIFCFTHSVYVYVTSIDFFAQLYANLDVNLQGEVCASGTNADTYNPLHGNFSLVFTVSVVPEGGASLTFLSATRVGISLGGVINYRLEALGSADTCANTNTCLPTLRKCVEVYNSWPGNYVEIYAWYQLRSIKWCTGRLPWGGSFDYPCGFSWGSRHRVNALSVRWNLGGSGRSKLWGQCDSPVDSSMCGGPSTFSSTEVGRIVPPRDFIRLSSGQVNFSCPQLPPLSRPAENVSELRPQDIKVVMALGDSITTGFGMLGVRGGVTEYRAHSWSIGGDPDAQTVATFLRFYTPDIVGASLRNKSYELTDLPSGFQYCQDGLNGAVTGAVIPDLPGQVTNLVNQLKELNDTGEINIENDWKLLTILIGGNDLCQSCCSSGITADKFGEHLTETLEKIRINIPRVFVNLVPMANLSQILYRLTAEQSEHCLDIRSIPCLCPFIPGTAGESFRQGVDEMNAHYNQKIRDVAQNYTERGYSDFAVVVQPFLSGTTAEDLTIHFLSDLDYFHPSLVGHQHMAKGLWNSMLTPAANKTTYFNADEPFVCPDSSTLLYTD